MSDTDDISAADFDAILAEIGDSISQSKPEIVLPQADYQFPYQPYDIQQGFMAKLFETLDRGKVGIFESPTGTGKSLSLICGSLAWLKHFEDQHELEVDRILSAPLPEEQELGPNDDWVTKCAKELEAKEERQRLRLQQEVLAKREKKLAEIRAGVKRNPDGRKRPAVSQNLIEESEEKYEDEDILPTNYDSDEDMKSRDESDEQSETESVEVTKIFFCSRTHSQLAQFAREIRKTQWAAYVKVINLGSRQNLCINDAVRKLGSLSLMNDRYLIENLCFYLFFNFLFLLQMFRVEKGLQQLQVV